MSATVFLSYSHKDMSPENWLERLKMYMAPLRRRGDVEIWDDSTIPAGTTWRSEIAQAIDRSKAAILLVGPGFLASEFITNEELPSLVQSLQREGLKIYPLIIGYSSYTRSDLKDFQAFNDPESPLEALPPAEQNKILNKLSMAVEDHLRTQPTLPAPKATVTDNLHVVLEEIQRNHQMTWKAFSAQCTRRDELVRRMKDRLKIRERLEFEKFFFRYFSSMNTEEKFQFDQIRALTEGPMYKGNLAILEILGQNPDAFNALPRLADLQQHLVFWLNKYEKVFVKTPEMCVLYTGVEDAVPFPSGMDAEIAGWLKKHGD